MRSVVRWCDPLLLLFLTLTVGSSVISAHGALVFFCYLVEPWLAAVFTAVLAVAIVGLDAAGTLDQRRSMRTLYYSGMGLFLLVETLANYFSGQAVFVTRVRSAFQAAEGVDLLTIATGDPVWSRVLVVLFLSLASLCVFFFTFAASLRLEVLRASCATDAPLTAQLTDRLVELERNLAEEQERTAQLSRQAAQDRAQTAQLATQLAQERDRATQDRAQIDQLRDERDQLRDRGTRAGLIRWLTDMVAREGLTPEQLAQQTGFPASTIRSWLTRGGQEVV